MVRWDTGKTASMSTVLVLGWNSAAKAYHTPNIPPVVGLHQNPRANAVGQSTPRTPQGFDVNLLLTARQSTATSFLGLQI